MLKKVVELEIEEASLLNYVLNEEMDELEKQIEKETNASDKAELKDYRNRMIVLLAKLDKAESRWL